MSNTTGVAQFRVPILRFPAGGAWRVSRRKLNKAPLGVFRGRFHVGELDPWLLRQRLYKLGWACLKRYGIGDGNYGTFAISGRRLPRSNLTRLPRPRIDYTSTPPPDPSLSRKIRDLESRSAFNMMNSACTVDRIELPPVGRFSRPCRRRYQRSLYRGGAAIGATAGHCFLSLPHRL